MSVLLALLSIGALCVPIVGAWICVDSPMTESDRSRLDILDGK